MLGLTILFTSQNTVRQGLRPDYYPDAQNQVHIGKLNLSFTVTYMLASSNKTIQTIVLTLYAKQFSARVAQLWCQQDTGKGLIIIISTQIRYILVGHSRIYAIISTRDSQERKHMLILICLLLMVERML